MASVFMALVARRETFLDGNLAVLAAKRSYILYGFSDLGLSLLGIRHKLSNRPAMPRDHHALALFDIVEQLQEIRFGV
jgi:hypothetical protein